MQNEAETSGAEIAEERAKLSPLGKNAQYLLQSLANLFQFLCAALGREWQSGLKLGGLGFGLELRQRAAVGMVKFFFVDTTACC